MADNYTCTCEKCGLVVDGPNDLEYVDEQLLCEFCRSGINPFTQSLNDRHFDLHGAGRCFGFDDYGCDMDSISDEVARIGE